MGWIAIAPVMVSADSFRLDRNDMQSFERSFEIWIQDLVYQISPKTKVNVIAEFKYSSNPDLIQNYEEKMAANHLPGVPDVIDLDMHPTQNPIYDLVTQQNVKLIFDRKPNSGAERVIRELVSSKISLNPARGDQMEFDYVNESRVVSGFASTRNGKVFLSFLAIAALAAAGFLYKRNRRKVDERYFASEKLNELYDQFNPSASMASVDPEILQAFVCQQEKKLLIEAMSHGSIEFLQAVLRSFTGKDRIKLFEKFEKKRLKVSPKKSRYAQIFLLAKLKDQMKIDAIRKVDALVEVMEQSQSKRESMSESFNELKNSEVSKVTEENEVSYEQSV